ncbi:hypothetical protein B0H16DRAFT_1460356 [Mycena metata]|uniref:Uncharacterized protein n=1 Tax=Mycena metata TaxID=1033252 RepID=A0AAD7IVM8_9AGAR|nr:hypothetical protein B0H16DRAFT_1460356 [Mycena metata]
MKASNSLSLFLAFVALVVSSAVPATEVQGVSSTSCKAADRVLLKTHNVTAGGHEFQVSTKACSADVLALSSQSQPRAIEKRQSFTVCGIGGEFRCVVGQGVGPLEADCAALSSAVIAAFEETGDSGVFSVAPQFVQELSLGTCLWAWINENPVSGGAVLQECYSTLTSFLAPDLNSCILNADTGGFVIPETLNVGFDPRILEWTFECVWLLLNIENITLIMVCAQNSPLVMSNFSPPWELCLRKSIDNGT